MIHDEAGLLGIAGAAADKGHAAQLMHIFCEHFANLAVHPVSVLGRPLSPCHVLDVFTFSPHSGHVQFVISC